MMPRHEMDALSLTCAAIFISIGIVFLTGQVGTGDFIRVWALPVALVAAGFLLGTLALARWQRDRKVEKKGTPDGESCAHEPHA